MIKCRIVVNVYGQVMVLDNFKNVRGEFAGCSRFETLYDEFIERSFPELDSSLKSGIYIATLTLDCYGEYLYIEDCEVAKSQEV